MELIIVGKYSSGVREPAAWVENHLGNLIGPEFAQEPDGRLQTIVFLPTIVDPAIGAFPDHITYKRSEPAVFVAVNIPYEEWIMSGRLDRARLFADALCKAIGLIRDATLTSERRASLVQGVTRALNTLLERHR